MLIDYYYSVVDKCYYAHGDNEVGYVSGAYNNLKELRKDMTLQVESILEEDNVEIKFRKKGK